MTNRNRGGNDTNGEERTEKIREALGTAASTEVDIDVESKSPLDSTDLCSGVECLPDHLRNPFAVLARGRELLKKGLTAKLTDAAVSYYDNELRMVARNGTEITPSVLACMRR